MVEEIVYGQLVYKYVIVMCWLTGYKELRILHVQRIEDDNNQWFCNVYRDPYIFYIYSYADVKPKPLHTCT